MSVYREQATERSILFCPRCNELLDQVDFGVDMCPRCEGFWIGNSVLDLSGRKWPTGPQVWWRNELRCPACATQGMVTTMNARTSSDVIIDQCFAHGVWLDRGELSRVMRDPAVQELTKLREHLAALEPSPEQLLVRRERWLGEQEERGRLAEIERKRIEIERTRRAADAAKTEAERAEERRKANEDKLREAERLAQVRRDVEKQAEDKRADWQRIEAELRIQEDRAAIAEAERARSGGAEDVEKVREATRARELARKREEDLEARRREAAEREQQRTDERRFNAFSLERDKRDLENRVEYLAGRVDSLRLELSTTESKLVRARSDLQDTLKQLDEQRANSAIE